MVFTKEEYNSRLSALKQQMSKKSLAILIITDPSNMNYTTGYDGWSFYVPQGVIIALAHEEPIWFGRMQDSKGAKVTTFLKEENILGYPEDLIQSPPRHPYDYITDFLNSKNEYLGGSISPGLSMRYKSLNSYTANLPLINPKEIDYFIGRNTEDSIHSGIINGIVGELNSAIDKYKSQFKEIRIILTGGDSKFLFNRIKNSIFANSNFLILGLNFLIELNKK